MQRREIATAVILSIVTCGIYGIYWMIKINDEVNYLVGDVQAPSGGMVFLLSIVTCGIYSFIWAYKMGEKLDYIYTQKGWPPQSRGVIYLVLSLFGLGIVSYALMQDALNKSL
ncbi:MAG: DUF4234 domain-containing protein [Clostridia bacterium]|nr:DUF4234 domain-containing protein [Clostridia bacterium]